MSRNLYETVFRVYSKTETTRSTPHLSTRVFSNMLVSTTTQGVSCSFAQHSPSWVRLNEVYPQVPSSETPFTLLRLLHHHLPFTFLRGPSPFSSTLPIPTLSRGVGSGGTLLHLCANLFVRP